MLFAVKPVPVQEIALVEDHESVEELPFVIEVGFAVSVTVGAGGGTVTPTVTEACAVPPAVPEHEIEYVVVAVGETEVVPFVLRALKPVPVQELALVETQVSVEELPFVIAVGEAVSVTVTVGATTLTVTVDVAEPPAPAQDSE